MLFSNKLNDLCLIDMTWHSGTNGLAPTKSNFETEDRVKLTIWTKNMAQDIDLYVSKQD